VKKAGLKLIAVLLCVVLLFALVTTASGTSNVYFMAVNENVVPMTAENMPIVVGGTLYVPYIMFSLQHTSGVNLGVIAQYSTIRRTVMVSQGQDVVIFDPLANTSYDLDGNPLDGRAILRDSMAYIPLAWVCEHFGTIQYSTTRTAYGTLVRVTNHLAILNDIDFVDAASDMLKENYRDYLESLNGQMGGPSGDDPVESGRPEIGPVVYLSFTGGERVEEMAQILENHNQRGLFLLETAVLSEQDELIRRLVGAGHLVGLDLQGSDGNSCLQQALEGSRLLAQIARCPVTVVRAAAADEQTQLLLREKGYALWKATGAPIPDMTAADFLQSMGEAMPNYVEIPCEDRFVALLDEAMDTLAGSSYRLRLAVAPAL